MLRLKKNVKEFIKANVKPDYREELLWGIEHKVFTTSHFSIGRRETLNGVELSLEISASDFEEVEDLKPYKWHTPDFFDGNPKRYWIIEYCDDGSLLTCTDPEDFDCLTDFTTHFMYIEPHEMKDED